MKKKTTSEASNFLHTEEGSGSGDSRRRRRRQCQFCIPCAISLSSPTQRPKSFYPLFSLSRLRTPRLVSKSRHGRLRITSFLWHRPNPCGYPLYLYRCIHAPGTQTTSYLLSSYTIFLCLKSPTYPHMYLSPLNSYHILPLSWNISSTFIPHQYTLHIDTTKLHTEQSPYYKFIPYDLSQCVNSSQSSACPPPAQSPRHGLSATWQCTNIVRISRRKGKH